MAAEPLRANTPESAPVETPKPEPASLNEVLTGKPASEEPKMPFDLEGASFAEKEQSAVERGREVLSKKKEFDASAESAAADFERTTSGWWNKTKSAFSKAVGWIRGEEEIKKLNARLEEVKSEYQQEAEAAIAEKNPVAKVSKLSREQKALEKTVQAKREREELIRASKGLQGEKMVEDYLAARETSGKTDRYGKVSGVAFDPRKGEIRTTYEDGSSVRRYASGLELRVLPGGGVETIGEEGSAPKKPEAQIVDEPEKAEEIFDEEEKRSSRESAASAKPEAIPPSAAEAEVTEDMIEAATPKWEHDTAEAEAFLRAIDQARTPEQLKALLIESGWMTQAVVAPLDAAAMKNIRWALKEDIASRGGIVVDKNAPPEMEASAAELADTAKFNVESASESPAVPEAAKADTEKIDLKEAKKPTRRVKSPAASPEAPAQPEKAEVKKNPYDRMSLSALEEAVASYRVMLAKGPDERLTSKLPQMEESLARRSSPDGLAAEIVGLKDLRTRLEAENAELDTPAGMEKFVMERVAPDEHFIRAVDESEVLEAWRGGNDEDIKKKALEAAAAERENKLKHIANIDKDIAAYEQKLAGSSEAAAPETVGAPAGETQKTEPRAERKLDILSKETMGAIVTKMDELGHADAYKKINTPAKLVKILAANGFDVEDLGSVVEESLFKNWKKAQDKYNRDKVKGKKP